MWVGYNKQKKLGFSLIYSKLMDLQHSFNKKIEILAKLNRGMKSSEKLGKYDIVTPGPF